jgi:SPW repeat-containing protein
MQKWMRWQVLAALVAGACAALSPLFIEMDDGATWTMVVLGVVTAAVAVWSLAMSEERMTAYALLLLGVLFIGAPWALDVASTDNDIAVDAWIIGAVVAIAGVLTLPAVEERMHHRPIPH